MQPSPALALSMTKRIVTRRGLTFVIGLVVIGTMLWSYRVNAIITTAVLASALRQSTPLVLGALCGLLGERSGVMNIGIEGQMLFSAFIGFLVNVWSGNLLLAVLAGILAGAVLGLLLAFMSVTLKTDQIIGGVVINILALGLTGYFYQVGLSTRGKLQAFPLGPLQDIPLVGPVLFNNPPITYLTILLVFIVHYTLFYSSWGLRTRAVGEHPRAADTLGINVYLVRYTNLIWGGAVAGLAGAFLTLEAVGSFERAMTNGRGFVALAVMIFGKWTPIGSWGAALLFGLATAVQTQMQFGGQWNIPHQFIGMLPYLLTVIVLAGFVGRARPPAALGTPYAKE
jgi:simple sugar transport system permease protein